MSRLWIWTSRVRIPSLTPRSCKDYEKLIRWSQGEIWISFAQRKSCRSPKATPPHDESRLWAQVACLALG